MKKLLSVFMVLLLLFSAFCISPTVSAEELDYVIVEESILKTYWEEFYEYNNSQYYDYNLGVIKVGDWYYQYAKKKSTQEITAVNVCGYNGDEDEITIPTKLGERDIFTVTEFYLMSNTVKTIKIPKEITSINGEKENKEFITNEWGGSVDKQQPIIECVANSQLEEIVVDGENSKYSSLDGVLFTKNFIRLIYYPVRKSAKKYVVPDTVKYISNGAFASAANLKSLIITPNVEELGYDSIPENSLEELRFENNLLPEYLEYGNIEEEITYYFPRYVPDVPSATVYCIEGSPLYEYYKEYSFSPQVCKEFKGISPLPETIAKEKDGKWYYYYGDYKTNADTLVKYKGVWFYVKNGVWNKTVTDKIIKYKEKWFYIKNGKWNSNINTLVKKDAEWLGIVNGKWDSTAKTLVKYQGKWFYVNKGKWCKDTAIVKYKGKRFYVKNGKVDFDYSGKKKINGKTYKIKNGKVA